ncbi:MAG: TonB-dependent receptor [Candidatus Kapaibacterium sp.]|nr:MAG: TonB-dependent receptor [Candidatus Kapabacteria bacterium]
MINFFAFFSMNRQECLFEQSQHLSVAQTLLFAQKTALLLLFSVNILLAQNPQSTTDARPVAGIAATSKGVNVISGTVNEAASGEAVIGVNVMLYKEGLSKISGLKPLAGARTNKFGFFAIPNVEAGEYDVVCRGIGYKDFVKQVTVRSQEGSVRVNIALKNQAAKSGEVVVQGRRSSEESSSPSRISSIEMSPEMMKKLPALGGEADVFRALILMPGVKASSEVSSGLYVRGGSPDQNLVLLDGVPIYNPSHLGGLLSVFNNDALRDTKLLKGAFPAEYGGRLSSVIDLTMKEGTKEKFAGDGGVSVINSRLTLEGPIGENATFMLSGRRLYLDLIFAAVKGLLPPNIASNVPSYYFYDLNAKLNYKLGENDRLYLSGYWGYDLLQPSSFGDIRVGVSWGNAIGNLRWSHIVSPTLFTNFSVALTNYDFITDIGSKDPRGNDVNFLSASLLRDWIVKAHAEWFEIPDHDVKFGVESTFHRFRGAVESDGRFSAGNFTLDATGGSTNESAEIAGFVQDEWSITPSLTVNAGLRGVWWQQGNYAFLEPRLAATFAASEDVTVKAAVAQSNQFVHLIIRNDIGVPSDVWFPSTERVKPASGTQYVLGVEGQFAEKEWTASVEGYYKSTRNVYEFKDEATFSLLAPVDDQFTAGTGEAYGVEFFLRRNFGQLTGWLGYTLSWAWRTFPDLNFGKPFAPRFDRRHDISVVLSYKLDERWELGATWVYQTGQAYTMPAAQFDFVVLTNGKSPLGTPAPRFLSTERNAFRLPAFHKLDLTASYNFEWLGLPFTAAFSVYNAYNRANPFFWQIQYESIPANTPPPPVRVPFVNQVALFPILPSFGIGVKF